MPKINLLTATTQGVDLKTNPLFLGNKKLHAATNLTFEEGVLRTRPGFQYSSLGVTGQFQGAGEFRPSLGLSNRSSDFETMSLVVVVDGDIYDGSGCTKITADPVFEFKGDVEVFQAEDYLIFQNAQTPTYWWNGSVLTESPGMQEEDWNDPEPQRTEIDLIPPVADIPECAGTTGKESEITLNLRVIDTDTSAPIADAYWVMNHNGNIAYSGLTDLDGRDSLNPFPRIYILDVTKQGYLPVRGISVDVFTGGNETEIVDCIEVSREIANVFNVLVRMIRSSEESSSSSSVAPSSDSSSSSSSDSSSSSSSSDSSSSSSSTTSDSSSSVTSDSSSSTEVPFGELVIIYSWDSGNYDLDTTTHFLSETIGFPNLDPTAHMIISADNKDIGPERVTIDLASAWLDSSITDEAAVSCMADWYPDAGGSGPAKITVIYKGVTIVNNQIINPDVGTPASTLVLSILVDNLGNVTTS